MLKLDKLRSELIVSSQAEFCLLLPCDLFMHGLFSFMLHIHDNLDSLTDAVAMDCEMVGVSSLGNKSALGRVTLVFFSSSSAPLTFLQCCNV